jgi:hypothetical protein
MNKQEEIDKINGMTHAELAWLWRFAPLGHPYFSTENLDLYDHFKNRFRELGGMTPAISKQIGWEEPK